MSKMVHEAADNEPSWITLGRSIPTATGIASEAVKRIRIGTTISPHASRNVSARMKAKLRAKLSD
jgi:hypothetical protein